MMQELIGTIILVCILLMIIVATRLCVSTDIYLSMAEINLRVKRSNTTAPTSNNSPNPRTESL